MQCMQPEHAAAFTAQVTGLAQHGFDLVVEVLLRAAAAAVLPVREDAFGVVGECPGKSLDKGGRPRKASRSPCGGSAALPPQSWGGFKPMGTVHNCRVRLPMRSHWREAQSGHTNRSSCTAT